MPGRFNAVKVVGVIIIVNIVANGVVGPAVIVIMVVDAVLVNVDAVLDCC